MELNMLKRDESKFQKFLNGLKDNFSSFISKMRQIREKEKEEIALFILACSSILILFLITVFVFQAALPAFKEIGVLDFLFGKSWSPGYGRYGAAPLFFGSFMIVFGSVILAVAIGVFAAIFLVEYLPRGTADFIKPFIELLAGIPSIIWGFFGLVFVAPRVADFFDLPVGRTALTAAIVLSFMIVPTIVSISSEVIEAVPQQYRRASMALGATKWQTIRGVVLPTAKPGIVASIMLAFGRAIGETIAVLMIAGSVPLLPSPFYDYLDPVLPATATIATEMGETPAYSLHWHALFALGIILFIITFVVNTAADIYVRRTKRGVIMV
jgi:phosphate transport system permease protein